MQVVICRYGEDKERDSMIFGPFSDVEEALQWLDGVHRPNELKDLENRIRDDAKEAGIPHADKMAVDINLKGEEADQETEMMHSIASFEWIQEVSMVK